MEEREGNNELHMQAGGSFPLFGMQQNNLMGNTGMNAVESGRGLDQARIGNPNAGYSLDTSAIITSMPPAKRKRGRPRKYADSSTTLALSPSMSSPSSIDKRAKKYQLSALGAPGQDFTPHVIMIAAGEDVATKIMAFSHIGPRAVCVLTANGAISNATLRQPAMSGGTVTYEGRFEILSLSGSFLFTDSGGSRTRISSLSISLANPDGHVVGGSVAGLLIAATPVQVVVGSFIAECRKNFFSDSNGEVPTPPAPAPPSVGGGGGSIQSLLHWTQHPFINNDDTSHNTDINISLPGG